MTLYVAATTASASRAAATAFATVAAEGAVPVDRAVAVKPSSDSAPASTPVGGPVVPDGEAGSAPTTSTLGWRRRDSGSSPPSLTSSVVVRSAIRSAALRCVRMPTVRSTPPWLTYGARNSPSFAFSRRTRRID